MRGPINKIIICGGGSAGWMTAAVLSKQFPDKEIALVESPNIPVIGVGESTLGTINSFLDLLGLKDEDWMPECQATYKLGIKFSDFYKKGEAYYYPFGVKDMQNTQAGATDWYVKKALNPETPKNDFYESFYSCMPFIYDNKIYDNKDGQLPNFSWKSDVAYHVDAIQFGHVLRDKVALPNGVVHVKKEIKKIEKDVEGYVSYIQLDDGDQLEADLFIDCTGFRSLLLGETMESFFEDFGDWLPNKRAVTCHVPYTDKELEMENVTNCTAWNNGWIWNIPLYNRIGAGYVYDPKFLTHEQAEEEFKEYLNSDRMKLHKPDRAEEIEKFDHIDIRNGVMHRCWVRNVVGVGLSYGFIEPLESTGLLSVQEILLRLCETLHYEQVNRVHMDHFNYVVKQIMTGFKFFVAYHFTLSSRRDTEYWRQAGEYIRMDPRLDDPKFNNSIESLPAVMANALLQSHSMQGDLSMGGIPDIFVGNNCIPANPTQLKVLEDLIVSRQGQTPEIYTKQLQDYWDQKKDYIQTLANDADSHYEYLRKNFYEKEDVVEEDAIEEDAIEDSTNTEE
jgi:hypothetical protein